MLTHEGKALGAPLLGLTEVNHGNGIESVVDYRPQVDPQVCQLYEVKIADEHTVLHCPAIALHSLMNSPKTAGIADVIGHQVSIASSGHFAYLVMKGVYSGISPNRQAPSMRACTSNTRR